MKLTIRMVQTTDAQGILDIINPIIEDGCYTVLDQPFTLQQEVDFIDGFDERGVFNIGIDESRGVIVGFQNVEPFAAFTSAFDHVGIIGTFVSRNYRRKGLASQLFEETFSSARLNGYEKLFAYVRSDNPNALAIYEKHGFKTIGTAKKQAKVNGHYIDEVFIEKLL